MPASPLSDDILRATVRAVEEHGGRSPAAKALGIDWNTVNRRMLQAERRGISVVPGSSIELPSFPDDDLSAVEILDQMERRFTKRLEHAKALHWFEVKVRDTRPLGINWFGDPHIGSNGCNVPLLRRDVELVAKTPGMVGANIGDTTDNWSGRLLRLYADNDVSKSTERRLAKWFLQEAGIPWLLWLEGNHDGMDASFTTFLRGINCAQVPMVDWRARFVLVFPNGRRVRIDAAHNHKGHSQWNELHGQERASVFDEEADLYIAGHHHVAAVKQKEMPGGRVVTLARARGYKWLDDHAEHNGFHQKQGGASVVTVIDPSAGNPWSFIKPFADAEEGAAYLTYLRKNAR